MSTITKGKHVRLDNINVEMLDALETHGSYTHATTYTTQDIYPTPTPRT